MSAADVIALLVETTVAASVSVLLVLLLRRPLRKAFGATVAYASWCLVPAAVVAVLLPATTVAPAPVSMVMTFGHATAQSLATQTIATIDYPQWLVALWGFGTLAMVARLTLQQRAFRAGLGQLRKRDDGLCQADAIAGLPAALGLWRPLIVVPADFESRYSDEQRRLMQAHERTHIMRGDLHLNAVVAAARCLFWFNPLLHLAARHFRFDQELACDQRVMARHPQSRRAYGEAMFKTQIAAQPLPLGCHWGHSHPLTERIAMLKHPAPSKSRWIVGSAIVTALTLTAGMTAWAAQPAAPTVAPIAPAPPAPPAAPAPPAPEVPRAPTVPDAPDAPPTPSAPHALSGTTTDPRALHPPRYPADALAQGVSGKVMLLIDIDAEGRPTAIEVDSAQPEAVFDEATVAAAWNWKFNPEVLDGQAIASRVRVPVEFRAPVRLETVE